MEYQIDFINNQVIKIYIKDRFFLCDYKDWIEFNCYNYKWIIKNNGNGKEYVEGRYKNKIIYFHRLINKTPKNKVCDHKNGNGLDNRKCNLRNCSQKQNSQNSSARKNSSGPYPGVIWNKECKKWKVRINYNNKEINLGMFPNLEEAIFVRKKKENELFKKYSLTNSRQGFLYKTLEEIIDEILTKEQLINNKNRIENLENKKGTFILFFANGDKEKDLVVNVDEKTNCWNVVSHLNGNPYPMYRKERVHIISYKYFKGKIPEGLLVRHTCDNPRCCNPKHLILGTAQDNVNDMFERNRRPLTFSKEEIIKIAEDDSGNYSELAEKYNTTIYIISNIKNKKLKSFNNYNVNSKNCRKNKLTSKNVIDIYNSKENIKDLANKYNVSESAIYDIRQKRTHKNILKEIKRRK